MPHYIVFDPNSTPVANRVTRFLRSVPESTVEGRTDVLRVAEPPADPLSQWKVEDGEIVALTADDLAALDLSDRLSRLPSQANFEHREMLRDKLRNHRSGFAPMSDEETINTIIDILL